MEERVIEQAPSSGGLIVFLIGVAPRASD